MTKIEVLQELNFGQRVAEEEGEHLAAYFVETDQWRQLYSDRVDIVYGTKGAGKSALYSLLNAREDQLLGRQIVLVPAENPRGTPAFQDLVTSPPASEREFINLWKLYFVTLMSAQFDELGLAGGKADQVRRALEEAGLLREQRSLQSVLRSVVDYVGRVLRPESLEADVTLVDPVTATPLGHGSTKITFSEPSSAARQQGVTSVDDLIRLCSENLEESHHSLWLMLDRLDVAFAESDELEQNALRALFKVYLDLTAFQSIRLKIFLRTDIWRRITRAGFREASHLTRHMTISWNRGSLLNVLVRRAIKNPTVLAFYDSSEEEILSAAQAQEDFFYRMCPQQVDVGEKKPKTFEWILSRTIDGLQTRAPRELIHLMNSVRNEQMRHYEVGAAEPDG